MAQLTDQERDAIEAFKQVVMDNKPSETWTIGAPIDLTRFAMLPVEANRDLWWQQLRNAYGLQMVIYRDLATKLDNHIAQTRQSFTQLLEALEMLLQETPEQELMHIEAEPEQQPAVPTFDPFAKEKEAAKSWLPEGML